MSSKEKSNVIDILVFVIFIVPMFAFEAYTGMKLWNWLIAETFGVMTLNMIQALGINVVITYLCPKSESSKKDDNTYQLTKTIFKSFITNGVYLLIGYIVYSLMK